MRVRPDLPSCGPHKSGRPDERETHGSAILSDMTEAGSRPRVGVGVVFIRDGFVFLARRRGSLGGGTWGSAGGHLEYGESLEDCARREALEEFGLRVGDLRFLCVSNIIAYGRHYVDVEFLGDIGNQEPRLLEPQAFDGSGWFPPESLPEPLFQAMEYAIDSVLTGRRYYSGDDGPPLT